MSARAQSVVPGRLAARRERFLKEGERIFLRKGYAGTNVNDIVQRAGGSLATLYNEFGSKEGLFAEIMCQRMGVLFDCEILRSDLAGDRRIRSCLVSLAVKMLDRILSKDGLALYRIYIGEGPRFPALRTAIVKSIFPAFLKHLTAALIEAGVIARKDGTAMAEDFLSLVHGQLVFRAACSDSIAISTRQRRQHAERAVEAFLTLHRHK